MLSWLENPIVMAMIFALVAAVITDRVMAFTKNRRLDEFDYASLEANHQSLERWLKDAVESGWELPVELKNVLELGSNLEWRERHLNKEHQYLFIALKQDFFPLINAYALLNDEDRKSLETELFSTCAILTKNFNFLLSSLANKNQ